MRKIIFILFFTTGLLFYYSLSAYSWGFFGHKRINKMAVFTLPSELIGFYKKHIVYIEQHAVDPDKRRYAVEGEAPRHYIDIEHYGASPFDSIPHTWNRAVQKYSEDSLNAFGIVPWHIVKVLHYLEYAFKTNNVEQILHYSADLGHYVADAHVPLHTTVNYNGKLTNQKGIHGFWESRIPELKADSYDYWVGRAQYIEKPTDLVWKIIEESHMAVDSVLGFERQLSARFEADKKYSFQKRGRSTVKVYSLEYTNEYNDMLDGMVERRMRQAIHITGSLWYTAWVNAGKPVLSNVSSFMPRLSPSADSAEMSDHQECINCH